MTRLQNALIQRSNIIPTKRPGINVTTQSSNSTSSPGTVTNSSQVQTTNTVNAGSPSVGAMTTGFSFSEPISLFGITFPLWIWLAGGGVGAYFLLGKHGR